MRRTSIAVLGLMLVAALGLVAAGCGGGGKKNAAATTTVSTETTAPATTEAMTQETTTEAATTEAMTTEAMTTETTTTEAMTTEAMTTEATTTTSDLSGLASAANCKELADLGSQFSSAFSGAANAQDLKKQAELLKEFADKTPPDIRPDFQTIADYLSKVAAVVGNVKPGETPDPATIAKLAELGKTLDETKYTQAAQNITAWVTKNCSS